jgi:hypothetical protein
VTLSLGRPSSKWEDNVKKDIGDIISEDALDSSASG